MNKSIVVIIGAGQLGSRHLQGVLKANVEIKVYVVEPLEQSREVAATRANEISHHHELVFCSNINEIPQNIDLVIVATNSNVRFKVLTELLGHARVETLILEKVLFQLEKEYHDALALLEKHNVNCYVNHPRRMQDFYKNLRDQLNHLSGESIVISAYGVNWGLGCNGLNLSDLFCYLLDDRIANYETKCLDTQIIKSKRSGYYEFTGTLEGRTEKGSQFQIHSKAPELDELMPISIVISAPSKRIFIQESSLTTITH